MKKKKFIFCFALCIFLVSTIVYAEKITASFIVSENSSAGQITNDTSSDDLSGERITGATVKETESKGIMPFIKALLESLFGWIMHAG